MPVELDSSRIRNFSIIAHIDHGKTTLTDSFLRSTKSLENQKFHERMLDSNPIEQERGITIKLAPVRMSYQYLGRVGATGATGKNDRTSETGADNHTFHPPGEYILNLIDTPGHVDFGYEVSRSLAACEGVLLVVDASQGIQAQTLSNYQQAKALNLTVIPVINKIDLPSAKTDEVILELMELCHCQEDEILQVSAKTSTNIDAVLQAVVERIPAPLGSPDEPLRALLITSYFDLHKGAVALVRVISGRLSKSKLQFKAAQESFQPVEIGIFTPGMVPIESLPAGTVGYVATGLKDVRSLKIGDTLTTAQHWANAERLAGFREPTPMVYMELYPTDAAEFTLLQDAVSKLALRDAALQYTGTHSAALGSGLRAGFLGILHAEIVLERLQREFDLEIIATIPSVTYKLTMSDDEEKLVKTPGEMPDPSLIKQIKEPIATATIFAPQDYMSAILNFCRERRGEFVQSQHIGQRVTIECRIPLSELITDFHDALKSLTSGYASLEYEVTDFELVDAVKVTIMLNKEPVEALSFIAVRDRAEAQGRQIVTKLKEVLPRQMFEVPIQAAIGGAVIARETIKAFRKDVTAKLYGGDVTRRKKLLSKQAKGKKRMKQFGKVEIDQDTFLAILKR
jgi:GTP-binding protein LepA